MSEKMAPQNYLMVVCQYLMTQDEIQNLSKILIILTLMSQVLKISPYMIKALVFLPVYSLFDVHTHAQQGDGRWLRNHDNHTYPRLAWRFFSEQGTHYM